MDVDYIFTTIFEALYKETMYKLPMHYYGPYNALCLYLRHPCFSPFLDDSGCFCRKEENIKSITTRFANWKEYNANFV